MRKIADALIKKWGTPAAKGRVWNSEYKTGKWTYARDGRNNENREPIYGFLEHYGAGGSILDLGCGSGMTALEMKNNFDEYVGIDVSEVAVKTAREAIAAQVDRRDKVHFEACDISKYVPRSQFSVILFRESIYYLPLHRIKPILQGYSAHLLPAGVLIVRLCDRSRYSNIIRILESDFNGKEAFAADDSKMSIFVCSPQNL
jgi:SAM-dependent methyltransferase